MLYICYPPPSHSLSAFVFSFYLPGFIWLPREDTLTVSIWFWGTMLMSLPLMLLVSSSWVNALTKTCIYLLGCVFNAFQGNQMLIFHYGSSVAKSTTHWSNPRVCLEIACTYVRFRHHIIHYSKLFRVRTCCLDKQHVIIVVSVRALIETWKMAE